MTWLIVPASYCLGSISFSLLLVGRLRQRDLREVGSGNAGASNVLRSVGIVPALTVLFFYIGKGVVPVLLGRRIGASAVVLGAAAVAVVFGHMYPIFHSFRGGKGVATAAGALGALQWQVLVPCVLALLVVVAMTRYVSLASLVGVILYPLIALESARRNMFDMETSWLPLASLVIASLIFWGHRANIRRLLAHTESKLGPGRLLR